MFAESFTGRCYGHLTAYAGVFLGDELCHGSNLLWVENELLSDEIGGIQ